MGDRNNKNTRQGFKNIVQVRVQAENVSRSKQVGSGKTQSRSTTNMGVVQTSSSGGGNSQTANNVRMMATTQQSHTTHHNRPQQNHQPAKNHGPQQNRPQQNKVAHKAPSALSKQNISINISLASLLNSQLQVANNQKPNQGNQKPNQGNQKPHQGNQKQHQNPRQSAAGGNQRKPSQQNPKNAGSQAYTKSSQKIFVNVITQNK